ncbi:MAG: flagellin [Pseudomonadota bacterium]
MTMISLGDMAQSMMLRRQNATLKSAMQAAANALTTGKVADVGRAVRGDFSPLAGLDASLARLSGYRAATTEAGLLAGVMQTALGTIATLSGELASSLLTASSSAQTAQVDAVGTDARQRLDTALSALNTRFADSAVFSGVAADRAPLPDADSLLTAAEAATASAQSAADIEAAVTTWFADPAGFAATYLGGPSRSDLPIGPGETATLDITATDPALRSTLAGLVMGALLDRGALSGQPEARSDLARRAGAGLMQAASDRTLLQARLGLTEARIDQAATRNAAETSALEIARLGLVEADPYEAAARLEAAETQLQSLYTITARLSRLSLVDYI